MSYAYFYAMLSDAGIVMTTRLQRLLYSTLVCSICALHLTQSLTVCVLQE